MFDLNDIEILAKLRKKDSAINENENLIKIIERDLIENIGRFAVDI